MIQKIKQELSQKKLNTIINLLPIIFEVNKYFLVEYIRKEDVEIMAELLQLNFTIVIKL